MRRLALAVLVAILPALALAQDRVKPIRIIVATGVGGTADVFMRVLGDEYHRVRRSRAGDPGRLANRQFPARRRPPRRLPTERVRLPNDAWSEPLQSIPGRSPD